MLRKGKYMPSFWKENTMLALLLVAQ